MITHILRWLRASKTATISAVRVKPKRILQTEHTISSAQIDINARKVLHRLQQHGYVAYVVGGGVRDLLLGRYPKDFDVATNALPEEVSALFRNCRLIGRRFRLAHVYFNHDIIEVATFRASHQERALQISHNDSLHSSEGMILRDNVYGTIEEDVWRRDFTVNALYYHAEEGVILDYVGGVRDLQDRTLRMIGDAYQRYREDPVRILRAIRFACKLHFEIHPDTEKPIFDLYGLIQQVSSARLFEEFLKLFITGHAVETFHKLRYYEIFSVLFPQTNEILQKGKMTNLVNQFLIRILEDTDTRLLEGKSINPAFLLAAFLWYPLQNKIKEILEEGMEETLAFHKAMHLVLRDQQAVLSIPRRHLQVIREIWTMQRRLIRCSGSKVLQIFSHPRFRAAYDFLLLRSESGEEEIQTQAKWWQKYISCSEDNRWQMIKALNKKGRKPKKKNNQIVEQDV